MRRSIPWWRLVLGVGAYDAIQALAYAHQSPCPRQTRTRAITALLFTLMWVLAGAAWLHQSHIEAQESFGDFPSEPEEILEDLASRDLARRVRGARHFRVAGLISQHQGRAREELRLAIEDGERIVADWLALALLDSPTPEVAVLEQYHSHLSREVRAAVIAFFTHSRAVDPQALRRVLHHESQRKVGARLTGAGLERAPPDRMWIDALMAIPDDQLRLRVAPVWCRAGLASQARGEKLLSIWTRHPSSELPVVLSCLPEAYVEDSLRQIITMRDSNRRVRILATMELTRRGGAIPTRGPLAEDLEGRLELALRTQVRDGDLRALPRTWRGAVALALGQVDRFVPYRLSRPMIRRYKDARFVVFFQVAPDRECRGASPPRRCVRYLVSGPWHSTRRASGPFHSNYPTLDVGGTGVPLWEMLRRRGDG